MKSIVLPFPNNNLQRIGVSVDVTPTHLMPRTSLLLSLCLLLSLFLLLVLTHGHNHSYILSSNTKGIPTSLWTHILITIMMKKETKEFLLKGEEGET